jgi:hypothetical protein
VAAGLAFAAIGSAAESAALKALDNGKTQIAIAEPAAALAAAQPVSAGKVYNAEVKVSKRKPNVPYEDLAKFSKLERDGVERKAERAALQKCSEAGERNCFVSSVDITICNVFDTDINNSSDTVCIAKAVAIVMP